MRWHFQSVCGSGALAARGSFLEFLQHLGVRQSDRDCAEMVFGELVGNAVRHAPGPIDITAHVDVRGVLALEIRDTGPEFKFSVQPPPLQSESGRGLYIASLFAADLRSENTGFGNRVTAILHISEPVTLCGDNLV